MSTWLFFLFLSVALALGGIREDSPTAQTHRQMWTDVKAAGWRRIVWLVVKVPFGAAWKLSAAMVRTVVYWLAVAAAAGFARLASVSALDKRPVRVRRLEICA